MTHSLDSLLSSFPETLQERLRLVNAVPAATDGEFVLYWMRSAVRADENPALDAAICAANVLGLSVLVYQALSDRHPYASDRHHTFNLEGARDVQTALTRRGIDYAFHLDRPGHRGPHVTMLSARAALVITEDTPVAPLRGWTEASARQVNVPIIAVDTACVVPMQLVGKPYERAFAFRNATKRLYEQRVRQTAASIEPDTTARIPDHLPFEPVDLQTADIPDLVSQCEIEHSIGPVPHTTGGSVAGYERWEAFKSNGLAGYAKLRNNPLADGVSRMSPYLHYGMVSPMRIARETAELDGDGPEKFLDELLIWRELAYAFCYYRADHGNTSALPAWALATLSEHATDERPAQFSWEALARGQTGDALWDAAQRSLLMHGELHNNVRMTWGKAILNWTPDAETALATIIDLNHRYALDGRDPASYGGILWCLGQFDRPFTPPRPIFGTVRWRSTTEHAKRLDADAYLQKTTRPLRDPMPQVAVIGAGISGLICARTLADHGFPVTVFEKSRGVGGRMATRRTAEGLRFDHGAQYFTARDDRFRRYVESWMHDGVVKPWRGRIVVLDQGRVTEEKTSTERLVAVPGMNAICKHLAANLDVRFETKVAPLTRCENQWQVSSDAGTKLGTFDSVIVTAPPAQTAELVCTVPSVADRARATAMQGCWAVMLVSSKTLPLNFDGAFVHNSPLTWIARNSSKPDRYQDAETWVLHASPKWSAEHLEVTAEEAHGRLLEEFWRSTGLSPAPLDYVTAHRWRFALPPQPLEDRCLFDREMQVAACGDWCAGPRVEGAFLSGMAAAGRVMGLLRPGQSPKVP